MIVVSDFLAYVGAAICFVRELESEDVRVRTIPIVSDGSDTVGESFLTILQNTDQLNHTSRVDLSLIVVWYFNVCD